MSSWRFGWRTLAGLGVVGLVGLLVLVAPRLVRTQEHDSVVAVVTGLRGRGVVEAGLFADGGSWLRVGRERATCRVPARRGSVTCDFGPLPAGRYAIALQHDENGDGRLGRNALGIPTEGWGFSNDARPGLGPPSFASATFTHGAVPTRITISIHYGL